MAIFTGVPAQADQVLNGPRTGVGGEGATHPWRFWIDGDPTVSPYRAHTPRRRKIRRTVRRNLTPDTPAPNVARAA